MPIVLITRSGVASIKVWWTKVSEPKYLKVIAFCYYIVSILVGLATIYSPPSTIQQALSAGGGVINEGAGPALTLAWGGMFLVGGICGAMSVFNGWWSFERLGIRLIALALGLYLICVLPLHFIAEGSRLTQSGVIVLASGIFAVRYWGIRKFSYEPRVK